MWELIQEYSIKGFLIIFFGSHLFFAILYVLFLIINPFFDNRWMQDKSIYGTGMEKDRMHPLGWIIAMGTTATFIYLGYSYFKQ